MPLAILGVAILSLALSGFQYNVYNNAYHIPIALGWIDDPAFARDPLVPTLHLFASPLYRLLTPFATEANLPSIFMALVLVGRIATFWALDSIGRSLGIAGLPARTAFLLILATSIGMYNESGIGADGLLIPYFSHSELAQAVALLSIAAILRGEATKAALLAGITFALNAFVGAWMLVPLGLFCLHPLRAGDIRAAAIGSGRAALAFAAFAAPVTVWILDAQAGRPVPPGFDYAEFLADFFPYHFFIGSATQAQLTEAAAHATSAAVAIVMLPRRLRLACAFGGLVSVCAAGIAVGELSSNRWLLNLHPMRSAGMVVLVGTPLIVAAALQALRPRQIATALAATLVMLGVLTARWPLVLPAMLILLGLTQYAASGRPGSLLARSWALAPFVGAGIVLATSLTISTSNCCYGRDTPWDGRSVPTNRELGGVDPFAPHWREVQSWARAKSVPGAMFLIPPDLDGFRTGARRPVWITDKDGGAVPWDPGLYPIWRTRMAQVAALRSVDDQRRYARANGIDYVVVDGRRSIPGFDAPGAVYRNRWFAVYRADRGR